MFEAGCDYADWAVKEDIKWHKPQCQISPNACMCTVVVTLFAIFHFRHDCF